MLRDLFSNKFIIGGLIFVVLVIAGTQLYSWHVRRIDETKLARTAREVQHLANDKEAHTEQDAGVPTGTQPLRETQIPLETDNTQMVSEDTNALTTEDADDIDLSDAFLSDDVTIKDEEETVKVPVSPFGFGPYPEVPADYPSRPTWERDGYDTFSKDTQRELELLDRVLIELWKQGERGFRGGSTHDGKVYPHYKDTAYVRYATTQSGQRYIARYKGDPSIRLSREQLRTGNLPSHLRVLDLDSGGIDPYQFLNLR